MSPIYTRKIIHLISCDEWQYRYHTNHRRRQNERGPDRIYQAMRIEGVRQVCIQEGINPVSAEFHRRQSRDTILKADRGQRYHRIDKKSDL